MKNFKRVLLFLLLFSLTNWMLTHYWCRNYNKKVNKDNSNKINIVANMSYEFETGDIELGKLLKAVLLGRFDNSRKYKILDNAVVSAKYLELSQRFGVCLATQTSLERMHWLVQVFCQDPP